MILLDHNISYKLKFLFQKEGIECHHVSSFGLHEDTDDLEIWNFAKANQYTILSKDLDFVALQNHYGFPPKLVLLRCGNKSTEQISSVLNRYWNLLETFLKNTELGIFEVF